MAVAGARAEAEGLQGGQRRGGERRYGGAAAALLVMPFAAVISRTGATRGGGQQDQRAVVLRAGVGTVRARATHWHRGRGHRQLHLQKITDGVVV